jgi:hypothetical protein
MRKNPSKILLTTMKTVEKWTYIWTGDGRVWTFHFGHFQLESLQLCQNDFLAVLKFLEYLSIILKWHDIFIESKNLIWKFLTLPTSFEVVDDWPAVHSWIIGGNLYILVGKSTSILPEIIGGSRYIVVAILKANGRTRNSAYLCSAYTCIQK